MVFASALAALMSAFSVDLLPPPNIRIIVCPRWVQYMRQPGTEILPQLKHAIVKQLQISQQAHLQFLQPLDQAGAREHIAQAAQPLVEFIGVANCEHGSIATHRLHGAQVKSQAAATGGAA